jgi:hypothetical protein
MAFKDDISMQEYYGSFPTTSKATAVSRKAGVRKISISPVLNAVGPSGEDRDADAMDRIPSPANPNRGPQVSAPAQGSSMAPPSEGGESTEKALKSNANLYVLGGGALLLALLVYRKLKK